MLRYLCDCCLLLGDLHQRPLVSFKIPDVIKSAEITHVNGRNSQLIRYLIEFPLVVVRLHSERSLVGFLDWFIATDAVQRNEMRVKLVQRLFAFQDKTLVAIFAVNVYAGEICLRFTQTSQTMALIKFVNYPTGRVQIAGLFS